MVGTGPSGDNSAMESVFSVFRKNVCSSGTHGPPTANCESRLRLGTGEPTTDADDSTALDICPMKFETITNTTITLTE